MSRSRFSIIPARAVSDNRLTDTQFRTLCAIGTFTSAEHTCYPKVVTIADVIGKTRETTNRAITKLKEYGYIRTVRQKRADGGWRSNKYFVILDAELEANDDASCDAGVTPPCDAKDHTPCDATPSQLKNDSIERYISSEEDIIDAHEIRLEKNELDSEAGSDLAVQGEHQNGQSPEPQTPRPTKQVLVPAKAKMPKKRSATHPMPEDWCPSSETMETLLKRGFFLTDLLREIEKCRLNFLDKPENKRPGWENTFVRWMTSDFCKARPGSQMGRPNDPIQSVWHMWRTLIAPAAIFWMQWLSLWTFWMEQAPTVALMRPCLMSWHSTRLRSLTVNCRGRSATNPTPRKLRQTSLGIQLRVRTRLTASNANWLADGHLTTMTHSNALHASIRAGSRHATTIFWPVPTRQPKLSMERSSPTT